MRNGIVSRISAAPDPQDSIAIAQLRSACTSVSTRATDRLAAAHDASHYLFTPLAVATPEDANEVAKVMATCRQHGLSLTFRSGGTSLSGQAGTDSVLVDTRKNFRGIRVEERGRSVRVQPGATVRAINNRLVRFARKLGPDPASEIACTIGGVIANNSSGMSCGTHANTYRTLESAVIVFPSGTTIDTAADGADGEFLGREPEIYRGLERLRDRVRSNADSMARLHALYSIKNTMGYSLNAFVDFDDPVQILEHLVVGSEGTLAFVAEASFATLPTKSHLATGLLVFDTIATATAALPDLIATGLATIELLDAASLRVSQVDPNATAQLRGLDVAQHAALLVEVQEENEDDLRSGVDRVHRLLRTLPLTEQTELSTDPGTRSQLWQIRKGLFAAVAGARPSGTTALLEDIAVPVERLGDTCESLIRLFDRHRFDESVIFGHAKDGNIHFLINPRLDRPDSLARYEAFTEDVVDLVLSQGGTLKAEHGTGRMMAPFVRRQFGDELYEIMWHIKRLFDPGSVLNPGVVLTDDPESHIRALKSSPAVEDEVDRCVECGYCEPVCPSKDLTLTPRERIVLRREMQRARDDGDTELLATLQEEYEYDGIQTCAVDGMCETACPVFINTGDLVRRLRAENQNRLAQRGWKTAAAHWGSMASVGGRALTAAAAVPAVLPVAASKAGRAILGSDVMPLYSGELPRGGRPRQRVDSEQPDAIYFSSCTTTMFGPVGDDGVAASFLRLCERAGVHLRTPDDLSSLCCGTPWKSKGLADGYEVMRARVTASLTAATDNGRLPVVCDASSCTEGLTVLLGATASLDITVLDSIEFVDTYVLPALPPANRAESVTIHPTCSSTRMGINPALRRIAAAAATTVVEPDSWGCCGFAGDRGMLHPELTQSATAAEAAEVIAADSVVHASLNRTCELGMTRATGREYEHILQTLDHATDPAWRWPEASPRPGSTNPPQREDSQ